MQGEDPTVPAAPFGPVFALKLQGFPGCGPAARSLSYSIPYRIFSWKCWWNRFCAVTFLSKTDCPILEDLPLDGTSKTNIINLE
jgi:hypothetical protein